MYNLQKVILSLFSCKNISIMKKIKIGLIEFTNCLPLNYSFERQNLDDIEFVYGTPAKLNKLMDRGEIVAASISSFEYLQNKNKYTLIKSGCISSDGECGSVLLFSNKKFEDLTGCKIGTPCDSVSSVAMLKILLEEYGVNLNIPKQKWFSEMRSGSEDFSFVPNLRKSELIKGSEISENRNTNLHPTYYKTEFVEHDYGKTPQQFFDSGFNAVLFIGDNALKTNRIFPKPFFVYDLGTLWKEVTGLPAVFGVWAVKRDWAKKNPEKFEQLNNLIAKAIETGLGTYFNKVLNKASCNLGIEKDIIKKYLTSKIKYNFTQQHEKSVEIFNQLYGKLKQKEFSDLKKREMLEDALNF